MTDPDLLAKRLALIETSVTDVMQHHLDDLLVHVRAVRIGPARQ